MKATPLVEFVEANGSLPWLPCLACLFPKEQCLCPYFHEPVIQSLPFEPKIDHSRPNPFK